MPWRDRFDVDHGDRRPPLQQASASPERCGEAARCSILRMAGAPWRRWWRACRRAAILARRVAVSMAAVAHAVPARRLPQQYRRGIEIAHVCARWPAREMVSPACAVAGLLGFVSFRHRGRPPIRAALAMAAATDGPRSRSACFELLKCGFRAVGRRRAESCPAAARGVRHRSPRPRCSWTVRALFTTAAKQVAERKCSSACGSFCTLR